MCTSSASLATRPELDHSAGPQPADGPRRPRRPLPVPLARPRWPVHHRIRRRLRRRGHLHRKDPTAMPASELLRRTIRPLPPGPSSPTESRSAARDICGPSLPGTPPTTTADGHIERYGFARRDLIIPSWTSTATFRIRPYRVVDREQRGVSVAFGYLEQQWVNVAFSDRGVFGGGERAGIARALRQTAERVPDVGAPAGQRVNGDSAPSLPAACAQGRSPEPTQLYVCEVVGGPG